MRTLHVQEPTSVSVMYTAMIVDVRLTIDSFRFIVIQHKVKYLSPTGDIIMLESVQSASNPLQSESNKLPKMLILTKSANMSRAPQGNSTTASCRKANLKYTE